MPKRTEHFKRDEKEMILFRPVKKYDTLLI